MLRLGSEADGYTARLEQLKKALETDPAIKKFNVLLFDVTGRWVEPKGFFNNDAEDRQRVLKHAGRGDSRKGPATWPPPWIG